MLPLALVNGREKSRELASLESPQNPGPVGFLTCNDEANRGRMFMIHAS